MLRPSGVVCAGVLAVASATPGQLYASGDRSNVGQTESRSSEARRSSLVRPKTDTTDVSQVIDKAGAPVDKIGGSTGGIEPDCLSTWPRT
jgi:hypothetical protein